MECSTAKAPLKGPFCCCFVHFHISSSSRNCSLDPPKLSEASFPRMGMHPWPSLTVQYHPSECLHPSPTGPYFPGYNWRPRTMRHQPCSSRSGSWLVLCTAEPWGVTHLTFEDESIPCFLLAILDQVFYLGTPRLWTVTYACSLPEWGVC
jgi:hypothetical protein